MYWFISPYFELPSLSICHLIYEELLDGTGQISGQVKQLYQFYSLTILIFSFTPIYQLFKVRWLGPKMNNQSYLFYVIWISKSVAQNLGDLCAVYMVYCISFSRTEL